MLLRCTPQSQQLRRVDQQQQQQQQLPSWLQSGPAAFGPVMRAETTPKTAAAATALGQIPEPRAAKFLAVLPRVASLLFMYLAVSLSLSLFSPLSHSAAHVFTK